MPAHTGQSDQVTQILTATTSTGIWASTTAATVAIICTMLITFPVTCIEARIHPDNLASQKLVESFGFKPNGFRPFATKFKDEYYDEKIYHFIIQ